MLRGCYWNNKDDEAENEDKTEAQEAQSAEPISAGAGEADLKALADTTAATTLTDAVPSEKSSTPEPATTPSPRKGRGRRQRCITTP